MRDNISALLHALVCFTIKGSKQQREFGLEMEEISMFVVILLLNPIIKLLLLLLSIYWYYSESYKMGLVDRKLERLIIQKHDFVLTT